MAGRRSIRGLSLVFVLSACEQVEQVEATEPLGYDFFLGNTSRDILQDLRIDRRVVNTLHLPMALDRMLITLASLNPDVPNLGITMVQDGQGWQLESPGMGEVASWLQRTSIQRQPRFSLELCVDGDGRASPLWTEGIAVAIGRERAEVFAKDRIPLSPTAAAWLEVLREAMPDFEQRAEDLARPFGLVPMDVVVAAGNRASSDAFAWVDSHIGINLEAFGEAYGEPDDGGVDRMTRILSHEYVHLLSYALYPDHRELRDTPLNRALWTMFFEGIGDYFSLSNRWQPEADGSYSPVTAETLQRLEPVLVDRLEALAEADSASAESELRAGISMGKFDEKWGSLPVALWLHSEAARRGEQELLASTIRLNREAVLPLALRWISSEYQGRVRALLERD